MSSSVQSVLQSRYHGKELRSACIGSDSTVRISFLRTRVGHLCSTTPRSVLSHWQSSRALMLPQLQVPLGLCSSSSCRCWIRSFVLCLSVPPLPEHAPQGILVEGGLCSRCLRLHFHDWLSSTVHPVCPQYVWDGGEAGSRTQPNASVTNFIRLYLHQFSIDSHGLNGYGKPLKRPFDRYQSRLEAINNGRDIRQINW